MIEEQIDLITFCERGLRNRVDFRIYFAVYTLFIRIFMCICARGPNTNTHTTTNWLLCAYVCQFHMGGLAPNVMVLISYYSIHWFFSNFPLEAAIFLSLGGFRLNILQSRVWFGYCCCFCFFRIFISFDQCKWTNIFSKTKCILCATFASSS